MAFQGEREPGVEMDLELVESMAQDENPEQEMLIAQEQFLPQPDPEPEMGAVAAAVYDTSPSLLHQNPPILAESAQPRALDIIVQAMNTNAQEMKRKMEGMENKIERINNKMDGNTNGMKESVVKCVLQRAHSMGARACESDRVCG